MFDNKTIVAQATPPGKGGVGVIRISGEDVSTIAAAILSCPQLLPRHAQLCHFLSPSQEIIDQGIALFFPGPHSFTGEDVLELHGHGGPVVMDRLIQTILTFENTRIAHAGEFTQRAFLNDKLDLTQAEAIADLIDASSTQAAKLAIKSLQGDFAKEIEVLLSQLIALRVFIEAAIDFPEEEIDFISDNHIAVQLDEILSQTRNIKEAAQQGLLFNEGMTVVIAGQPNAGKSSLLNALTGDDTAIVTDIPGTTRDVLKAYIQIDGMPLHVIDTAGLRDNAEIIEQEGIKRAHENIRKADRVLLVIDSSMASEQISDSIFAFKQLFEKIPITVIANKIDLLSHSPIMPFDLNLPVIAISAKTKTGLETLKQHLKTVMGYTQTQESGIFLARRRHLVALEKTSQHLIAAKKVLDDLAAGELVAEELRQAQHHLSEITGAFSSDDLLGEIFSSFCIGK